MRLCGIISRFQLLSPGIGQVTHALLTRPPLSYYKSTRRSQFTNSVRLACVRHAASVHPEPGSNSQFIIRSGQNHLLTLSVFLLFLSYARLGCMKDGCSELFSADLICFLEFFRVALLFICQGALLWFSAFPDPQCLGDCSAATFFTLSLAVRFVKNFFIFLARFSAGKSYYSKETNQMQQLFFLFSG